MSTETTSPLPPPAPPAPSNRLVLGGTLALAAVAAWFWFNSPWQSMALNALTISICALGVGPMLRWLQRGDTSYPLAELLQLTMVPFYAIPVFSEHEAIMGYSEDVLAKAVFLVVIFQVSALLGAIFSSRTFHRPPPSSFWRIEFVSEGSMRFTTYTMVSTSLYLLVSSFSNIIPNEYNGAFRAVFFGVGTLSNFIQARMWGAGQLTRAQRTLFTVNILLQILLQCLSLLLVAGIITSLLTFVGYFSSARRIPWAICGLSLLVFGVLHNGKHQMRKIYWEQNTRQLQITDVPGYFSEWVGYGLDASTGVDDKTGRQTSANIFQRASLIQIVSCAVDTVPDPTPYLDGETYALILPQILPRFLWPNKPSPNDSVKILSVRLGILSAEQAETTSIGYGLITESYVNFGYYGTGFLGFILGWVLRRGALVTRDCTTLSIGGIFRILCLAWCLNTETTLAVWLSSFYQACIAIFVPLFFLQSLFR